MVRMSQPSICMAKVRHARAGLPSIWMVQAPHTPCSQPTWVPVRPARACLTLAIQIEGCDIRTIEDLAPAADRLSVLQEAFRRHHALQCGFCTPGILMSLDAFLRDHPDPSEPAVREYLSGHLCRCTGYVPIIAAALDAARRMREAGNA